MLQHTACMCMSVLLPADTRLMPRLRQNGQGKMLINYVRAPTDHNNTTTTKESYRLVCYQPSLDLQCFRTVVVVVRRGQGYAASRGSNHQWLLLG